ncbi:MAG: branched-chain amino acid ABC transporter permease, partial [Hyphomicrobiales bacterium]|nr:branched-chain amino acid ABC transporter permease [Hyphomicrobiales bacterium]
CVICMAVLGMAMERLVVRPILGYPQFSIVMATIGLGMVLRALAGMFWGTDDLRIETPFSKGVVHMGPLVISADNLSIIVATALLCVILYSFFRFTRMGVAMQAVSQNMLAAYYMGIPVKKMFAAIWAISAMVATTAGILLAPITFIHANLGFLGLKAFPAAVLGGFTSIPGALAGGVIIGIVETLSGFYLPEGFKDIAAYVVLLAVLLLRPQGLFGGAALKKV